MLLCTRKSFYQQYQETDLAIAWASRIDALLTLKDRNYGGLEDDKFDIADAHDRELLRKQFMDQSIHSSFQTVTQQSVVTDLEPSLVLI